MFHITMDSKTSKCYLTLSYIKHIRKIHNMSSFDDRKNVFENKFALDEALLFKAEARCCKLFGLWLAEKMEMSEEAAQSFASDIISANLEEPGFDDVKRHVMPILEEKRVVVPEDEIDAKLAELFVLAQEQIKSEAG